MKKVVIGLSLLVAVCGLAMAHTYSCGDKDPNCTKQGCTKTISSKCNSCTTCENLNEKEKESAKNREYEKALLFKTTQEQLNCKPTN